MNTQPPIVGGGQGREDMYADDLAPVHEAGGYGTHFVCFGLAVALILVVAWWVAR